MCLWVTQTSAEKPSSVAMGSWRHAVFEQHLAHLVDLNGVCNVTDDFSKEPSSSQDVTSFFFFLILFSSHSEAAILTPACKH